MRRSPLGLGFVVASSSLWFVFAHVACGSDETPPATPTQDAAVADVTTGSDARTRSDSSTQVPTNEGPLDPDAAARAALVLASCITERGADSVLEQIYARVRSRTPDDYRAWVTCIDEKRNGCQAITDCMGVSADLTGPCADSCMGDVSVGCDDQLKVHVDCAFYGEICHASTASCAPADAVACDSSTFARRCSPDGRVISCSSGFEHAGPKCADYGLTCNGEQCAGTEGACQAVSGSATQIVFEAKSCDGTRLVACAGGGLTRLDCGLLVNGATCQPGTDGGLGPQAYCGLANQCVPGTAPTLGCSGDSVTMCNGGRIDTIDCKTMGFSSCMAVGSYAFCAPSLKADAFGQ